MYAWNIFALVEQMFITVLLVHIENMPLTVNERQRQMTFSVHFP